MNGITTSEMIKSCDREPHSLLKPFISHYVYRSIQVPKGRAIKKSMPLRHTSSIDFFLGEEYDTIDLQTEQTEPFLRCTIRGPRTYKKYYILLKGHFISFTIKFHPTGLYRLLGIPMFHFANEAVNGQDIIQLPLGRMEENLLGARDIDSCIRITESYLLPLADKRLHLPVTTENIAQKILHKKGQVHITLLAKEHNLSLRQVERNFIREVGISPKTYSRMLRFDNLLKSRIARPGSKWTSLALESDYFDQMHLVKEFRHFLGITPSAFVASDFAF